MKPDFPNDLIQLIRNGVVTLEYVKGYVKRSYNKGTMDNLDYVEILNVLKEYERTQLK